MRNTICAALTATTLALCTALAGCGSAVGIFICASNGIGPAQYEVSLRRIEHCVICGRWWKLYAASSHLTIWTEPPGWVVWLLRHKTWKTMHNQQRKESK